eukprot:2900807-Rhodomonas_salina.3
MTASFNGSSSLTVHEPGLMRRHPGVSPPSPAGVGCLGGIQDPGRRRARRMHDAGDQASAGGMKSVWDNALGIRKCDIGPVLFQQKGTGGFALHYKGRNRGGRDKGKEEVKW